VDVTSIVLSKADSRALVAAHIAAAMMASGDRDPGEDVIRNRAELAVKIAKAIEEAVARSLVAELPADSPARPSMRVDKI
jgi:hypothetical protein